jgi:hypothetical protein
MALPLDGDVEDFRQLCLPSTSQPDNLPWLLNNGFQVIFTAYTTEADAERVRTVLVEAFSPLAAPPDALQLNISIPPGQVGDSSRVRAKAFVSECQLGIDDPAPVMLLGTGSFFGNGSLRNLALYCRRPGTAAGVVYLRVKREPFFELLRTYFGAHGSRPIPNAELVDIALRCETDALADSIADRDRNASYRSGTSFRRLSDDIRTATVHFPFPMMFWPEESDISYFHNFCVESYQSLDQLWPAKLISERRWRFLASRDLFFMASVTAPNAAPDQPSPCEDGRLFNEAFAVELPHAQMHESVLATLRRRPFLPQLE